MALIRCPECGNDISEHAEKCPFCGCPHHLITRNVPPAYKPPDDVPSEADSVEDSSESKGYRSGTVPADVEMLDTDEDGKVITDTTGYNPYTVKTYLSTSILVTIFCCVPFGIVAIVYSAIATDHLKNLRYEEAYQAGKRAYLWCQIGCLTGLVITLIWALIYYL